MKESNSTDSAFTLMYNETTTKQVRKQMDILVTFWLETKEKVVVCFLKALFFGHTEGLDVAYSISNIKFDEEFKFPADCLLNLSSDGHNGNKTVWKRMNEALEEKKMEPLMAFIPCKLHVVHNSFWE